MAEICSTRGAPAPQPLRAGILPRGPRRCEPRVTGSAPRGGGTRQRTLMARHCASSPANCSHPPASRSGSRRNPHDTARVRRSRTRSRAVEHHRTGSRRNGGPGPAPRSITRRSTRARREIGSSSAGTRACSSSSTGARAGYTRWSRSRVAASKGGRGRAAPHQLSDPPSSMNA